MLKKQPFLVALFMVLALCLSAFLPTFYKQFFYALSVSVKSIIISVLPILIFVLILKAIYALSKSALKMIGLILFLVCASNFCSTFLSKFVGHWLYHADVSLALPSITNELEPLWIFEFPKFISNNISLFLGLCAGICSIKIFPNFMEKNMHTINRILNGMLIFLMTLVPIFIFGFIIKLQSDGLILKIIQDYSKVFLVIVCAQVIYIFMAYFILNNFNIKNTFQQIKNMLPALFCGLCTMSSAASMPLTLSGVERNCRNKDIARAVVPATVNIHLVGDCIAIPILAFAIMKSFGVFEPTLVDYFLFTISFVLAKFSVAAVPGGGIIVMLPVLEKYLGFNTPMLSLITALYILFDPVITSMNVLGNSAFARLIDKISSARIFLPKLNLSKKSHIA